MLQHAFLIPGHGKVIILGKGIVNSDKGGNCLSGIPPSHSPVKPVFTQSFRTEFIMILVRYHLIALFPIKLMIKGIQGGDYLSVFIATGKQLLENFMNCSLVAVLRQGGNRTDSARLYRLSVHKEFIMIVDNPGRQSPILRECAPILIRCFLNLLSSLLHIFLSAVKAVCRNQIRIISLTTA